jgi:hypothetical protein
VVTGIQHHDTFAQVLHNVLVQFGKVGQVDAALSRQLFADLDASRQRLGRERYREDDRSEDSGGRIIAGIARAADL